MGFRLIKENSHSFNKRTNQLKESELLKEITRWSKLTSHTDQDCDKFIDHYQQVLSNNKNQIDHGQNLANDLGRLIKGKKMNLVNIQGNLEIDRLMQLISDVAE
jgi:transcriptional regulator of heat shock response